MYVRSLAVLGLAAASQSALAQYSGSETGYVICTIHFGDREEVTEQVPPTEVTLPRPSGSTGKNIQFVLSRAFQEYLLKQGRKFYQSACHENGDLDQVKATARRWEGSKGYGVREKREIDPHRFWPAFLDFVHAKFQRFEPSLSRSQYSYAPVAESASATRSEPAEREPKEAAKPASSASQPAASKPPAAQPRKDAAAAAAADKAKREAEFQAKVAAHQAAVASYERQVAAREAEIARQQREHEAAQDAAARQIAAHRKELEEAERRQQEYRAAQQRHAHCVAGDQAACAAIMAGELPLGE
jgi:pyruvate/2-oxoglutarate dehydrogenase complex dihydrolipoamide acyltransferase (E2) component